MYFWEQPTIVHCWNQKKSLTNDKEEGIQTFDIRQYNYACIHKCLVIKGSSKYYNACTFLYLAYITFR